MESRNKPSLETKPNTEEIPKVVLTGSEYDPTNDISDSKSVLSLDMYLSDIGQNLVSGLSLTTASLGLICGGLLLYVLLQVVDHSKIQSSMWVNLIISLIVKSLVMVYVGVGDFCLELSNSEQKCRFRYALSMAVDIACLNNFQMLLMERLIAIHCPVFYSRALSHMQSTFHMFGWVFGAAFFMFVGFGIQIYDSPIQCRTPYLHMSPVDSVHLICFLACLTLLLVALLSMWFLFPASYSKAEKLRLHMEVKGTYLVFGLVTTILLLWLPRELVVVLYLIEVIEMAEYTIFSKLAIMVMDLTLFTPFFALLFKEEFRQAMYYLVTCRSLSPVKNKLLGQESYKTTIRKLVEQERKIKAAKALKKKRKSSASTLRTVPPLSDRNHLSSASTMLHARSEFTLRSNNSSGSET